MMGSRIFIGDVFFDNMAFDEAVHWISTNAGHVGGLVVTPNIDHLQRVRRDPTLAVLYDGALLSLPDGVPVRWLARIQGVALERVSGADLFPAVCRELAQSGKRVAVLGTRDAGRAEALCERLASEFPGIVAQVISPRMGFERTPEMLVEVQQAVVSFLPDAVFVCLGSPKQELFAKRLGRMLPKTIFVGAGAAADFYLGDVRRAPRWVQSFGLEWLFRLINEPHRLWRRYVGNVFFLPGAMWREIAKRVRRGNSSELRGRSRQGDDHQ